VGEKLRRTTIAFCLGTSYCSVNPDLLLGEGNEKGSSLIIACRGIGTATEVGYDALERWGFVLYFVVTTTAMMMSGRDGAYYVGCTHVLPRAGHLSEEAAANSRTLPCCDLAGSGSMSVGQRQVTGSG